MLETLGAESGSRKWKRQFSKGFPFKDVITKDCQKIIRSVETTPVRAASSHRKPSQMAGSFSRVVPCSCCGRCRNWKTEGMLCPRPGEPVPQQPGRVGSQTHTLLAALCCASADLCCCLWEQEQDLPARAAVGRGAGSSPAPSPSLWACVLLWLWALHEHRDQIHILRSACLAAYSSSLALVLITRTAAKILHLLGGSKYSCLCQY